MYVVLSLIFLLPLATYFAVSKMLTFAQSGPSQNRDSFDKIKRRMELREEMHKRMRDKLLLGIGPDQDMFKDLEQMFEDTMTDSFSGFDQLGGARSNFHSEWQESKTGRTLVITPQSPEQKLNIDVNATVISIKGESRQQNGGTTISSSFTNSFPVPDDCDGSRVKMDQIDGKLLVQFPYKKMKSIPAPPTKEERRPIPPSESDIQI